ncbi:MAG TPA: hypothetical protein VH681_05455, partial [Nitrospiraceae bacterium]
MQPARPFLVLTGGTHRSHCSDKGFLDRLSFCVIGSAPAMNTSRSAKLFAEAQQLIPGGVNSPVRAFRSVGGQPRFIARAKGSRLYDVDRNPYIDYVLSWGPMILG